jgi:hypothetical protein
MENRTPIDTSKTITETINMAGFFNNFLSGFIIGVITGFFGNMLYDWYKETRRGKKPFVNTVVSGDMIKFEGQITNSHSSQTSLYKLIKNVE